MIPDQRMSIFGQTCVPGIFNELSGIYTVLGFPTTIAVDSQQSLLIGNLTIDGSGSIAILPRTDISFGPVSCPANVVTSLSGLDVSHSILSYVTAITHDTEDTLFLSSTSFPFQQNPFLTNVCVLPRIDTSFCGVVCPANIVSSLHIDISGAIYTSIALDSHHNLFLACVYAVEGSVIYVLPPATTTIFGIDCSANELTPIVSSVENELFASLVMDASQNLWVGVVGFMSQAALVVLPYADTTLYGIDVSANVFTLMFDTSGACLPGVLALDAYQNLFLCESLFMIFITMSPTSDIFILPRRNSNLYSHTYPANQFSSLSGLDTNRILSYIDGIAFDAQNNLFVSNIFSEGNALLVVLPPSVSVSPPTFPYFLFGVSYTIDTTYLFSQTTVQRFLAGYTGGEPLQTPVGTLLQDTGRRVYAFGRNRLKTYIFYEVLLVGKLEFAYICVWAASGIPPSLL